MQKPDSSNHYSSATNRVVYAALITGLALVVLAALAVIRGPQPALAGQAKFYLECSTTQVREGDSFEVTLVAEVDYEHNSNIGAFWYTDAGTAGTSDFTNRNGDLVWGGVEDSRDNRVNEAFQTTQDNLVEGDETFTVRFGPTDNILDVDDPEKDNVCEITIVDDDPNITNLDIISSPARDNNTYGINEDILIEATFSTDVSVNVDEAGDPSLGLLVGSNPQEASYSHQSATNKLVFAYEVQAQDRDADGFSMAGGYEDSDGLWHNFTNHAAITAPGANDDRVEAYRVYSGLDPQSDHKIDGSLTPFGTNTEISSSPAKGNTYRYGETIDLAITFSGELKVDGDLWVNLRVGNEKNSAWKAAKYREGSGTNTLTFSYTVQTTDKDTRGVEMLGDVWRWDEIITEEASVNGGTLKIANTDTDIDPTFDGFDRQPGHKVDGRPYPKKISISSTPEAKADTYGVGEVIQVSAKFDQNVTAGSSAAAILLLDVENAELNQTVTSTSGLLVVDTEQKKRAIYASGNGTPTLVFEYTVLATDQDNNGVGAFVLHDQDIKATGTRVDYQHNPGGRTPIVTNDPNHKVDGSLPPPDTTAPTVSSLAITSEPGDDDTYGVGDEIEVTVTFSETITATGTIELELNIGGQARAASNSSSSDTTIVFTYTVVVGDNDTDGIAIDANSLSLISDDATIQDAANNDASLSHNAVSANSGHQVLAPGGL